MAETYLRKARGTTGPLPRVRVPPPYKPEHSPALIAAFGLLDEVEPGVLAPPRNVTALHLTLLKPDGSGKANVPKPKLMIGSPGELPFVLAPVNDLGGLAITEGIEDALTVHQATGQGAWAACGAGRMPALADAIPRYVEA
jgi:putative DNA primase/helicase